jgi:hypothetical protein
MVETVDTTSRGLAERFLYRERPAFEEKNLSLIAVEPDLPDRNPTIDHSDRHTGGKQQAARKTNVWNHTYPESQVSEASRCTKCS